MIGVMAGFHIQEEAQKKKEFFLKKSDEIIHNGEVYCTHKNSPSTLY